MSRILLIDDDPGVRDPRAGDAEGREAEARDAEDRAKARSKIWTPGS